MYRINNPKVVSNSIGGEVIIINLDSGFYYSLNQTAGALWDLIIQGYSGQMIKEELISTGHPFASEEDKNIEAFIDKLIAENLIVKVDMAPHQKPDISILKSLIEPPAMERFEDMQELLVLDPIHEVGDAGWPVKKE